MILGKKKIFEHKMCVSVLSRSFLETILIINLIVSPCILVCWIWYIPTNAIFYTIMSITLILKRLKTLKKPQHVSISIQIFFRELVVSSLKSLILTL